MQIQNIPTENLVEYARNPRKNDAVVDKMVACIKEFGFRIPIVAKSDGTVVDGHLRLKAARKLGLEEVPVVNADDLTEAQIKAFRLVANQSANWTEWDEELLKLEFKDLEDLNYDLELTGFDLEDIQKQLDELEGKTVVEEDDFDESEMSQEETPVVTKPDDLWILGDHRLLCGDSTKIEDVERLMNGEKADMVFTDPPYNVDYSNAGSPKPGKTNLGKIKNDKMEDAVFYQFLKDVYLNLDFYTKDNSSFYIWYASKETLNFISALNETKIEFNQQIIWKKPMLLGRSKYQWAHEPCIFGIKGSPYFTDDRTKTTVWDFGGYDKSKNVHPTQKPLFLPSEALKNSSRQENIILDIFGGSGSTLIACEQLNRKCFMMEIDPKYCDVIIRRWQKLTGRSAVLESTGKTFDEIEEKAE